MYYYYISTLIYPPPSQNPWPYNHTRTNANHNTKYFKPSGYVIPFDKQHAAMQLEDWEWITTHAYAAKCISYGATIEAITDQDLSNTYGADKLSETLPRDATFTVSTDPEGLFYMMKSEK